MGFIRRNWVYLFCAATIPIGYLLFAHGLTYPVYTDQAATYIANVLLTHSTPQDHVASPNQGGLQMPSGTQTPSTQGGLQTPSTQGGLQLPSVPTG